MTESNLQVSTTGATAASSLTGSSYTPTAGSNRIIKVQVHHGGYNAAFTGVTVGGVSCTAAIAEEKDGNYSAIGVYYLLEADFPSFPADVVVSANKATGLILAVSTLDGVDQTTPLDVTPVSTNGTTDTSVKTSSPSIDITPVTDGCTISALYTGTADDRTISGYGTDQSGLYDPAGPIESGPQDIGMAPGWTLANQATAATASMSMSLSGNNTYVAIGAVAWRPASASGFNPVWAINSTQVVK